MLSKVCNVKGYVSNDVVLILVLMEYALEEKRIDYLEGMRTES